MLPTTFQADIRRVRHHRIDFANVREHFKAVAKI